MTETYLKTLAKHLVNGDRQNALRLCNRVLKEKKLIVGKRRFWEQMQYELKKPDPEFADFEFARILGNKRLSEHDYNHILDTYEAKASVLSVGYFDAHYHALVMKMAKEVRST